ncbi:MAG TPA: apolipoprotein N-acyltransferase [Candidatus Binatia bacterium]|nr:apolipoprotein N-acyltransferase [Candidatus Binatia bacterium]
MSAGSGVPTVPHDASDGFPPALRVPAPLRPVAAIALGAIATLGYAPFGQWYLSVIALALLLGLAATTSWPRALGLGWLYGAAHFGTGVYWVYISTHVYGGAPAWLGASMAAGLATGLALFPAAVLALCVRLRLLAGVAGWLAFPALWVLAELLRGHYFFAGFPWLSLGELSLDTPLSRVLPLLGVHGAAWVVAFAAFGLFRIGALGDRRRRRVAAAWFLMPALTLLLPPPSAWTEPDGAPIPVALVQSDIRQEEKWLPAMRTEALVRHWRLTQEAWPTELVVWPEVAVTQPLHVLEPTYLADVGAQAAARNATVLLGVLVFEGEAHYNSVVTVGSSRGRYDKHHLVPFGEYFPIPDFLRPLMDVIGTPYKDFAFGAAGQPPLLVNDRRVAVSICFEDVFGDEVRRQARDAAYGVNVTNDAWFAHSSAPYQHLQFTRLRAAENGRWFARTANTGISALIDADGNVVQHTVQFRQATLRGTVEPRRGHTPYQLWGDWPLWIGMPLLALGAAAWRRRRS